MDFNLSLYLRLISHSLFKSRKSICPLTSSRLGFLVGTVMAGFPLLYLNHRISWWLDHLFFPGFRSQKVEAPLFIVAPHRSGTTLLLNTLLHDPQFTTTDAWEVFFAPSLLERKVVRSLFRFDREHLGGRLHRRVMAWEAHRAQLPHVQDFLRVHPFSFTQPEEDQFLLLKFSTYDLLAFFPFPELLAPYRDYSRRVPEKRRKKDMAFYQDMVQRHVYAHGGKRYLSKQPSLSSTIPDLVKIFPDARFIHLVRHPADVVPSSMTLWRGHWRMYGCQQPSQDLADAVIEHNRIWYLRLWDDLAQLPAEQYIRIRYEDLKNDLHHTIEQVYQHFGMPLAPEFRAYLQQATPEVRAYKSNNHYDLSSLGITMQEFARRFADVAQRYAFTFPETEG
ncbi:MAG: sulfotransferase [Chloroflexi bacterium]|nr:sulfotransferase [Chloroflexota bacterium]